MRGLPGAIAAALLLGSSVVTARFSAWASSPPQARETPVIAAGVAMVRLDVVVVDPGGHPVTGLRAEDFEVREDGLRQKIVTFEPVVVATVAPAARAERTPPPRETAARPTPSPSDGRHLLIFFDDVHVSPPVASRVRSQLGPCLSRALRDGDWVMIVAPASGINWTARSVSEYPLLQEVVQHLPARRLEPAPLPQETAGSADERSLRTTLSGLQRSVGSLAGIPGRKSVVFISEGFGLDLRLVDLYDRVIDAAGRAQVAISFVNAQGLSVGLAGWSAESSRPPALDVSPVLEQEQQLAGVRYVSAATGGREFGSNDLARGVGEALEELSAYYLLGYEPPASGENVRNVRVGVVREGLRVRARERYHLKPVGLELAPALRAVQAVADETTLPLTARARFGRTSIKDGVETTLTLVLGDATRARKPGDYRLFVEGRRLEGGTLTPPAVLVRDLVSSEPHVARGLHLLVRGLRLKPGHWQLRVVVQDQQRAVLGSVLHTLEVPGQP
jgi:VWFA-related protein